jgi:hypothetical protein
MGRLISVLAAVGSAVFLALIVLTLSQNRLAALATGTLFLAIPYVVHWSGLARIDLLALLLATAALYVSVRWGNGRGGLITAAILLVAAAYTRQSYALAAPLGAFLWLWQQERQRAYTLAGIVAGLGIGLFVLINLLTDGGFYTHIITANVNAFDWGYLGDRLAQLASDLPLAILLALALLIGGRKMKGWELRYRREDGRWRFAGRELACWYYMPLSQLPLGMATDLRKRYRGEIIAAELPESLATYRAWHE